MLSEVIALIVICMILIMAMSISCGTMVQMTSVTHVVKEAYSIDAYAWSIHYSSICKVVNEIVVENIGRIPFVITLLYYNDRFHKVDIVLYPGEKTYIHTKVRSMLIEICSLDYKVCKYIPLTENELAFPPQVLIS